MPDENDELSRFVDVISARGETLESLRAEVVTLHERVGELTASLNTRPTDSELAFKRRRLVCLGFLYGVLILFAQDLHVKSCAPGVRASAAVQIIASGDPDPLEEIREVAQQPKPAHCDVMFPIHPHNSDDYPTFWVLAGGAGYVAVFLVLGAWLRQGWVRSNVPPHPERKGL